MVCAVGKGDGGAWFLQSQFKLPSRVYELPLYGQLVLQPIESSVYGFRADETDGASPPDGIARWSYLHPTENRDIHKDERWMLNPINSLRFEPGHSSCDRNVGADRYLAIFSSAGGALSAYFHADISAFRIGFFTLALLCKQQAIALFPLFSGLYLSQIFKRPIRTTLLAVVLCVILVVVLFLPYMASGSAIQLARQSFIEFGRATGHLANHNGHNIWYLLCGPDITPDTTPLFKQSPAFFCPRYVGFGIFLMVSLFVFLKALLSPTPVQIFKLATIQAIAFFFLPGSQERYLLFALPMAAAWAIMDRKKLVLFLVLTFFSFLNTNSNVHFNNIQGRLWVSAGNTVIFLILILSSIPVSRRLKSRLLAFCGRRGTAWLAFSLVILAWCVFVGVKVHAYQSAIEREAKRNAGIDVVYLSDLEPLPGSPAIRVSGSKYGPDRNPLNDWISLRGLRYPKGIVMTPSVKLSFRIPERAKAFRSVVGVEDCGKAGFRPLCGNGKYYLSFGSCAFRVYLDGKVAWESDQLDITSDPLSFDLPVSGNKEICLFVDPRGSPSFDIGAWASACFIMASTSEVGGN